VTTIAGVRGSLLGGQLYVKTRRSGNTDRLYRVTLDCVRTGVAACSGVKRIRGLSSLTGAWCSWHRNPTSRAAPTGSAAATKLRNGQGSFAQRNGAIQGIRWRWLFVEAGRSAESKAKVKRSRTKATN